MSKWGPFQVIKMGAKGIQRSDGKYTMRCMACGKAEGVSDLEYMPNYCDYCNSHLDNLPPENRLLYFAEFYRDEESRIKYLDEWYEKQRNGEKIEKKYPSFSIGRKSSIPLSIRFKVLKRDNFRCRICGAAAKDGDHVRLEVDHITARSKGGTDDMINLWCLCYDCNRGKGNKEL
jgi:5-methylcytosine-specific restriction endonuclease McrA